jgi:hypothetical protein
VQTNGRSESIILLIIVISVIVLIAFALTLIPDCFLLNAVAAPIKNMLMVDCVNCDCGKKNSNLMTENV